MIILRLIRYEKHETVSHKTIPSSNHFSFEGLFPVYFNALEIGECEITSDDKSMVGQIKLNIEVSEELFVYYSFDHHTDQPHLVGITLSNKKGRARSLKDSLI